MPNYLIFKMSLADKKDVEDGNIVSSALILERRLDPERVERIGQVFESIRKLPLRSRIILIVLVIAVVILIVALDIVSASFPFLNAWMVEIAKGNATAQPIL